MAEPEARIWATSTDLEGTNQQRKRYYLCIEDNGVRKDVELVIGPGTALAAEPFVPYELDYTIHDHCDHENDDCVLEDEDSWEYEENRLNEAYFSDLKTKQI